jgi:F-type H+-transporting ATPase subunit gamma
MRREESLKRRLQTLVTLHDAVGAMRSLSAHHFRMARLSLAPARVYREQIDRIVAEVGIRQPARPGAPVGLMVVASDLGLCGDYNTRLGQLAADEVDKHAAGRFYSVGRRVRGALSKHGLEPARSYDAPASAAGLTRLLLRLAVDLLDDYVAGFIGSLYVVAARFDGIGRFSPITTRVMPIEPVTAAAPLRQSPYVDPQHLRAVAVREFLYITLHEILLDALAAEHGMRLMASEAALQWLEETSRRTGRQLTTSRGESATQELLDIVAGGRNRSQRPA